MVAVDSTSFFVSTEASPNGNKEGIHKDDAVLRVNIFRLLFTFRRQRKDVFRMKAALAALLLLASISPH